MSSLILIYFIRVYTRIAGGREWRDPFLYYIYLQKKMEAKKGVEQEKPRKNFKQ